ncbi:MULTISPECIES: Zn-ribbon containing protein [Haloferax]|uniref:OapC/ArvC family zinc-ribbon domain-containing protein n=1 Tax=Haloferax TaxID=2251 RepID=UPI0037438382
MFPDGSKEMLSGCPNCGGNKFQFKPASSSGGPAGTTAGGSDDTHTQRGAGTRDLTSSAADAVRERAAATESRPDTGDEEVTVSDWVNSKQGPEPAADAGPAGSPGASSTDSPSTPANDSPSVPASDSPSGSSTEPSDDPTGDPSSRGWGEWPSAPDKMAESDATTDTAAGEPTVSETDTSSDHSPHIRARETDEDNSQKSARSDVVTPEELAALDAQRRDSEPQTQPGVTPSDRDETADAPDTSPPSSASSDTTAPTDTPPDVDGTAIEPSSEERPNLDQLREELNDQFESIKIVNPGQYELNLMELYDRDEYIISLREDGRYVIEVPDSWGPGSRED